MESNDKNLGWLTEEEIKALSTEELEKYKEWAIKRLNDLNADIIKTNNELDRNIKNMPFSKLIRDIAKGLGLI